MDWKKNDEKIKNEVNSFKKSEKTVPPDELMLLHKNNLRLLEQIAQKEKMLSEITENANDLLVLIDMKDQPIYISPRFEDLFEQSRENFLNTLNFFEKIIHSRDKEFITSELRKSRKLNSEISNLIFRVHIPEKAIKWIWLRESLVKNNSGKAYRRAAVMVDITDRMVAEENIKRSELQFRNIFNHSSDIICISSLDMRIIMVNSAAIESLGYTNEQLTAKKLSEIVNKKFARIIKKHFNTAIEKEFAPSIESELIKHNQSALPVEISSKLITLTDKEAILTIIRDITERKLMEKKIIDTIVETEEKERTKLAADLHDEIGPLLSTMKLYLSSMNDIEIDNKKRYIIEQMQLLVKEAINSTREISNALSPHLLTNHGLHAAVKSFLTSAIELIPVYLNSNIQNIRLPNKIEIVYYRIIRELINNSLKHANASEIQVSLFYEKEQLKLKYSDDGKGCNLEEMKNISRGHGLMNIETRVKSINGIYAMNSGENQGFNFELITIIKD